jgi:dihydroorotase
LKILLRGGRVIDPASKRDETADVLIDGGKIAAIERKIREGGAAEGATMFNAEGLVVAPGLVDMHVHFREPGQEYKEDIASGSRAAAAGGVTSVACMPNTDPPLDNDALIAQVVKRGIEVGLCRVHPIAAITRGIEGREITEMMLMRQSGAVGFSDDGRPVADARVMRRALEYARLTDVPVISHCEETSLSAGGHMHEGAVSTRLGIKGIPAASEDLGVARDVRLAEITGGRLHVCHVSSARSVEIIRQAKARGVRVTAEATPHHFTLTDESCEGFDSNTKMNPPLRSAEDREAVIQGLIDGTLDAIATDHAPHAEREKLVEFDRAPFGIIGLETSLALAITSLVVPGHLELAATLRLMSTAPSAILGLDSGTLKKGASADVVVFDPNMAWTFEREDIRSKSQNTPFLGYPLTGRVLLTIHDGKIVHERKETRARLGTGQRSKVQEGEPLGSARG